MKTSEYPGQEYKSMVEVTNLGDYWEVVQVVIHRRSLDLINWEEKESKFSFTGSTVEEAMLEAMLTLDQYLTSIKFDLFLTEDNKEITL